MASNREQLSASLRKLAYAVGSNGQARLSDWLAKAADKTETLEADLDRYKAKSSRQRKAYRNLQRAFNERDLWWQNASARARSLNGWKYKPEDELLERVATLEEEVANLQQMLAKASSLVQAAKDAAVLNGNQKRVADAKALLEEINNLEEQAS